MSTIYQKSSGYAYWLTDDTYITKSQDQLETNRDKSSGHQPISRYTSILTVST